MLEIKVNWTMRRKGNVCMIFTKTMCTCHRYNKVLLEDDGDICHRAEILEALICEQIEYAPDSLHGCNDKYEICKICQIDSFVDVI